MKKILLSASVCMLALFAGCTRDIADNGNEDQNSDELTFIGSTEQDATRLLLGDVNEESDTTPILWEQGDVIGIFYNYPKKIEDTSQGDYIYHNVKLLATTTTAATTTGFKPNGSAISTNYPDVKFCAYYPWSSANDANRMFRRDSLPSPLKSVQTYDVAKKQFPDRMFMVAGETPAIDNSVKFKFTNTFALVNVGIKGDAKIDGIKVSGFTKSAVYDNAIIALTKAPAAGSNAAAFEASGFFTRTDKDVNPNTSVQMNLTTTLRIPSTETYTYFPLMIMPTEFDSAQGLTVTVYMTNKEGKTVEKVATLGKVNAGIREIKTNDIIYMNLKPIMAVDHGQDAPKSDFEEGYVFLDDNFSSITSIFDDSQYLKSGLSNVYGADYAGTTCLIYDLNSKLKNTYLLGDNLNTAVFGMGGGNGRLLFGFNYGYEAGNGNLVIPIDLQVATETLKFTFKAANYVDSYGNEDQSFTTKELPVKIIGPGTIKGGTEKTVSVTPVNSPNFSEFTIIIEGATADTQIQIGADNGASPVNGTLIDDLKIVVAASTDVNNTAGTTINRPAPTAFTNITPADGNVTLGWNKGQLSMFDFTLTGAWTITGKPDWCSIQPSWYMNLENTMDDESMLSDDFGNELPAQMRVYSLTDNDTGTARSATITVTAKANPSLTKTFTITQVAAPAKETLVALNFGSHSTATPITRTTDYGATVGASYIIPNAEGTDVNGMLELYKYNGVQYGRVDGDDTDFPSLRTPTAPTYPGATPEGCLVFTTVKPYSFGDIPINGIGFNLPVAGKSKVIVSFYMFCGFDNSPENIEKEWHYKDSYGQKSSIVVMDNMGGADLKVIQGWNHYTATLDVTEDDLSMEEGYGNGKKEVWILPPVDSRSWKNNSVLLDDVKVEVQ